MTSTRDNSVAVYDQATMKQLWTNAGLSKDDPNWIEHPARCVSITSRVRLS